MNSIKTKLSKDLSRLLGVDVRPDMFTTPPSIEMGDLSLPCFELAKQKQQNPNELSEELVKLGGELEQIEEVKSAGPYANFVIKRNVLNKETLENWAEVEEKSKEKVMIEYSQPNTHKEFHVGHLRNACLGASVVNILRFLNKKDKNIIAANYIGDTGVHVAKCLWYITKELGGVVPEDKQNGEYLGFCYSEAVRNLEEDASLMEEVSEVHRKLEAGDDKDLMKLWQDTKEWSMNSFYKIYDELNVKFDEWFYEGTQEEEGKKLIGEIIENKTIPQIKKSEGAIIADLTEYNLDVLVLIKSDGNALYGAKDLPLGKEKFDNYKIDRAIYIVDKRQSLYLKQIFKLLDLLGYEDRVKEHIAYDFVTLPDGAMSSRKGNVVSFENAYAEMKSKAAAETVKRHDDWQAGDEKVVEISKNIALSAIKFWMLKYDNNSVIEFTPEKALAFDGDTGPYLLYTVARINSILRKEKPKKKVGYELLSQKSEKELIIHIGNFVDVVQNAAAEYSPAKITTYLVELAQKFNKFYHECHILKEEENLKQSRLKLAEVTRDVLTQGLALLNIDTVEEM